jgi:peptide/nickel transport system permease protein
MSAPACQLEDDGPGMGTPIVLLARVRRHWLFSSVQGTVATVIVAASLLLAGFGRLVAPDNPSAIDLLQILRAPSWAHPFGTDEVGRDLLSRVLAGATYTLPTALAVVAISLVVGCALGILAGFYGGWRQNALMRLTDLFLSYPALLIAIAVAAALGPGLRQSAIAISVVSWASYARLAQVQATRIRHHEYIGAAKVMGSGTLATIRSHVVPNSLGPVITKATMDVAFVIEWIAGLGFIGLGAQPPTPEWGSMIATSRQYVLSAWWYVLFPGLALLVVVMGFTLLGDALDAHLAGSSAGRTWRVARRRGRQRILGRLGARRLEDRR